MRRVTFATMRSPFVLVLSCVFFACASSSNNDCDPAAEDCPCSAAGCSDGSTQLVDGGPTTDGDTSDAGPLREFGEACAGKAQCQSNICLLVGIGGVCSDFCSQGSCPDGYGCFGVFGAVEPGEVADVCVPQSTQICSPCRMHSECAIVGSDLCLEDDGGQTFCARDCSAIECPDGYSCTTVEVEGASYRQCLPDSGACDCTASEQGSVEPCTIATPFGTCQGARVCQGDTGWGECAPPSATDSPDGSFADDNCDGIDGDIDAAIFVAIDGGTDGVGCGLSYDDPCESIAFGVIRAVQSGRSEVYVQAGNYQEVVPLMNGIDIYGGYDAQWQRDVHTVAGHRVQITGGLDNGAGGDSEYLTIRAHDLVVSTKIADVVIVGPDANTTANGNGRSSYAVHVRNALVELTRVSIISGDGAGGSAGGTGQPTFSASAAAGMTGTTGGNADEFTTDCNNSSHGQGGARGVNSCGTGRNPSGGNGGNGGEMDGGCSCFGACICDPCGATPGDDGNNASFTSGTSGLGGGSGSGGGGCSTPSPPGRDGFVQNGSAGGGGASGGFLTSGYWYARSGGAGGLGQHGGGGGGGGGSGGCDVGTDSFGAGGGGGGAGGCAATSGGGGGGGGGGSFGIFAASSTVVAAECTIQRGSAGNGGTGGAGGHGQRGGAGAVGGLADGDSKAGGAGGDGAHGGHGGGGGGGAGGVSVGVYSSASTINHTCQITGGSSGTGGAGGASAPNAPVAERDGNPGSNGGAGILQTTATCSNPSSC